MPLKGKKRQLHVVRNYQDNPNAVKNRQDNLNAVKNRQDNPNAVRKQLTGLLLYYCQNCLICTSPSSRISIGDQHSIITISPSSRISIGDHNSVITTSPSSCISIGGHISATTTSSSTHNITFVTRDDRNSPVKIAKPTIGSS